MCRVGKCSLAQGNVKFLVYHPELGFGKCNSSTYIYILNSINTYWNDVGCMEVYHS